MLIGGIIRFLFFANCRQNRQLVNSHQTLIFKGID